MNISRENIDDLNAVVKIGIEQADYQPKVEEAIEEYRRKARFDGFRPGKVPASLVKKIYGKSIQTNEIQNLLSDTLNNYIRDNQIRLLGEPIPNENSPVIDWENQESFEFHFDIGISPEVTVNIGKKDKLTDYRITVTEEMIDKQTEDYTRRFGSLQPAETVEAEDAVKGDLCELSDAGHSHDHGDEEHDHRHPVHAHGALIFVRTIADDHIRNQFIGAKAGDRLVFNPNTAFPNETDRASLLGVSKDELKEIDTDFEFTVSEVSRFSAAEVNQELFDKAFGEGAVDSVESFRERIREDLERQMDRESRYKFHVDAREKLLDTVQIPLPEEFLKRWMLMTSKNDSLTPEQLEKEFPAFARDLRWRMIKNNLINEQQFEATEDEIREQALWAAQSRYYHDGIYNAPVEQLFRLADVLLKNEEEKNRITDIILENKVIEHVKTLFSLVEKKISLEDFNKLMNENN